MKSLMMVAMILFSSAGFAADKPAEESKPLKLPDTTLVDKMDKQKKVSACTFGGKSYLKGEQGYDGCLAAVSAAHAPPGSSPESRSKNGH